MSCLFTSNNRNCIKYKNKWIKSVEPFYHWWNVAKTICSNLITPIYWKYVLIVHLNRIFYSQEDQHSLWQYKPLFTYAFYIAIKWKKLIFLLKREHYIYYCTSSQLWKKKLFFLNFNFSWGLFFFFLQTNKTLKFWIKAM